jgi:predicted nucleotidyltransferase
VTVDFRRPFSVITPTLDGDVLAVLAGADEEFTGRRIHRVLGRGSEQGIRRAADRLVEQGIVSRRQAGQAKLYSLNRDHLAAPYVEGIASLSTRLVARLAESVATWEVPPALVFLFGSVARAEGASGSDLDLFVVRKATPLRSRESRWDEQLADLERDATTWTGNDARVVEYGRKDLADAAARELAGEVVADGVPIYGTKAQLQSMIKVARS